MKGVIFNVVQEAVEQLGGADLWDDIVDKAGASGAYTGLGNYEDAELVSLVVAASDILDKAVPDVLVLVGRTALPHLANKAPELIKDANSPIELLMLVNDVIHVEVLKLYPDSDPPELRHKLRDDGALLLTYKSKRNMGDLAEGLIRGTGDFYDQPVELDREDLDDGAVQFVVKAVVPAS